MIVTAPAITLKFVESKLAKPATEDVATGIAVDETAVINPFELTVIFGIVVLLPKLPTLLLTVARVAVPVTLLLPSKDGDV